MITTRRRLLAAIGVGGATGVAGCLGGTSEGAPPATDYPMDRFDASRSATAEVDSAIDPGGLTEAWSVAMPSVSTPPPSVYDGTVYVNDREGRLLALDPVDGSERRSVRIGNRGTRPTVTDGGIYVVTRSGVAAYDHDGTRRWRHGPVSSVRCTPVVHDGRVFVTYVSTVKALDAASGDLLWAYKPADEYGSRITLTRSVAVRDGTVYAASESTLGDVPDVFAIDAATGEERWSSRTGLVYQRVQLSTPDGGLVTVGQRQTESDDPGEHIEAHDVVTRWTDPPARKWQTRLAGYRTYTPSAIDEEHVYAPTTRGLVALALSDGTVAWRAGDGLTGAPVVAGEHVWVPAAVSSETSQLRVYTRDGERVATYDGVQERVVPTQNVVFAVTDSSWWETLSGKYRTVTALVPE